LPPKLTPPEFHCSSVNASTLDLIKFNCGSFNVSTLPTNLTVPSQAGDMRWMLVYSPNTSHAATRMALGVTRLLNVNVNVTPIGTVHRWWLLADVDDDLLYLDDRGGGGIMHQFRSAFGKWQNWWLRLTDLKLAITSYMLVVKTCCPVNQLHYLSVLVWSLEMWY